MHGDGKPHSINVCHVPRTGGLAQAEARVLVVVVDERLIAACVMRHSGRDVGFRTRRCGRLVDATDCGPLFYASGLSSFRTLHHGGSLSNHNKFIEWLNAVHGNQQGRNTGSEKYRQT